MLLIDPGFTEHLVCPMYTIPHSEDAVNDRCFPASVILYGRNENGDLKWEQPANVAEGIANKVQGHQYLILF